MEQTCKARIINYEGQKNKTPELLPLTSDTKALRIFLLKEFNTLHAIKERKITYKEWTWLQKLTVVGIISFNARRSGESTKIEIVDWERCSQWKRLYEIQY